MVLGAVFSLGAFQLVRQWDQERAELNLSLQAQVSASAVRAAVDRCDLMLRDLAELLGRRGDLSRAEFAEVARPLLLRHPELLALEWVPVVPQTERAGTEEQARRELGRPFEFMQSNAAGRLQRAGERALHWPILYVEPLTGNEVALGLDLAVEQNRTALGLARDEADLVLSRPIRLVQETGHQLGYVAMMPVYRGGGVPRTVAERQARLTGFAQGVLRVGDFLRSALRNAPSGSLEMMALDLTSDSPQRVVHFLPAQESALAPVPTEAQMRARWHSELPVKWGGRQFALLFRSTPGAVAALWTWNPYGALLSGLLLTVGGAFYLRGMSRRAARVEAEVAARTAELSRANAQLSAEVAARRREQQALAESEARFRALFESSPDAIFVESSDGLVLDANPAACRLHGMARGELLGRHVTELVPPERRAAVSNNFASLFSPETSIRESESLAKDGRVIPIELAACRCEYGGQVATLIHARDISERRRNQAALERRDRILHAVARTAQTLLHAPSWQSVAVEVFAELGTATASTAVCLFANEPCAGEIGFRSVCQWPPPEPANEAPVTGYSAGGCARWRELLARGETVHGHVSALPVSERHVPARKGMKSIALTPIFAGADWWGFLALGQADRERDWSAPELEALTAAAEVLGAAIARAAAETERVRIEARLQETQKLESLGVLAGGIAHDFNNLLTSILGNASLARLDLPPHSPVEHSLGQIEQTSLRAAELCKQMLAYAGKGRLVVQAVDLARLVQDTTHLLQVSVSKKAVLRFDLGAGLPPVLADASQLRQVLVNLVMNASEAIGDRSGIIAVHTGLVRADRRYLADARLAHSLPEGDYVFLEVSDTGCGMTPELKARIFEPFFTTKFMGRGIGLSAVLGIVRGHRGALKVYTEPGKGSTFKLLLPIATDEVTDPPAHGPLADGWRGSGRVLLADDEETVRAVVARLLENLGFTVTVAADGREAAQLFEAEPHAFTLVVMDLTMPHLDGAEAFARMRLANPAVRVVLMSGFSEADATVTFAGKGLAGFLQKPFEMAHLIEKVRGICEAAKQLAD